jgi:hypothetical protein
MKALMVIWFLLAVAGIGGWIANVVKLVGMDFASISGLMVARGIGVFVAPLGSVLGFI